MDQKEYDRLKRFLEIWWEMLEPPIELPPEYQPLALIAEQEKRSPSNARKSLRIAINDIIERYRDFDAEQISALDDEFSARGVPTLTELRLLYSGQYQMILKRGYLSNEEEYYLIADVFAAGAELPQDGYERIRSMLAAYEASQG
jgi:hypothetical protein